MLIREPKPGAQKREMKIKLPADLHIRLHISKIVDRERIGDVVVRALDEYFNAGSREPPSPES